jgi:hypothetical protein
MFRAVITDGNGVRVSTVPNWAAGLGLFGVAAIGLFTLVIGAGLALLLAPLAIAAVFYVRWRLRAVLRDMAVRVQAAQAQAHAEASAFGPDAATPGPAPRRPASDEAAVIDGEYRVIDNGR